MQIIQGTTRLILNIPQYSVLSLNFLQALDCNNTSKPKGVKKEQMKDTGRGENKAQIYITCLFQLSFLVYQWPVFDSPSQLGRRRLPPSAYLLAPATQIASETISIYVLHVYIRLRFSLNTQSQISIGHSPHLSDTLFSFFLLCSIALIVVLCLWHDALSWPQWRCWRKLPMLNINVVVLSLKHPCFFCSSSL